MMKIHSVMTAQPRHGALLTFCVSAVYTCAIVSLYRRSHMRIHMLVSHVHL